MVITSTPQPHYVNHAQINAILVLDNHLINVTTAQLDTFSYLEQHHAQISVLQVIMEMNWQENASLAHLYALNVQIMQPNAHRVSLDFQQNTCTIHNVCHHVR